jgi:hypothetical protein
MSAPGDEDRPQGFLAADVERIRQAVLRLERYYKNPRPQRQRWPAPGWSGAIPARATAGFAAGSITTPSSASVTFYVPAATGAGWTLGTVSDTAYNTYTGTVATNATVWLQWFGGKLYVITANC